MWSQGNAGRQRARKEERKLKLLMRSKENIAKRGYTLGEGASGNGWEHSETLKGQDPFPCHVPVIFPPGMFCTHSECNCNMFLISTQ